MSDLDRRVRNCQILGLVGAGVYTSTMPVFLLCWSLGARKLAAGAAHVDPARVSPNFQSVTDAWIQWQLISVMLVGTVLGAFREAWFGLFTIGANTAGSFRSLCLMVLAGAALLASVGLAANWGDAFQDDPYMISKRWILVFASVVPSGLWLAWQAWRVTHPDEKFWPRFSLGILMISVIAWGALLAVFAPR